MLAKFFLMFTFLDDACDTSGSIPEVESMVNCLERYTPWEHLFGCIRKTNNHLNCYLSQMGSRLYGKSSRSYEDCPQICDVCL